MRAVTWQGRRKVTVETRAVEQGISAQQVLDEARLNLKRAEATRVKVSSTSGCSVWGFSPARPSWTRVSFASAIAEHSPCQTDEYVFECRLVRRERNEL